MTMGVRSQEIRSTAFSIREGDTLLVKVPGTASHKPFSRANRNACASEEKISVFTLCTGAFLTGITIGAFTPRGNHIATPPELPVSHRAVSLGANGNTLAVE